MKVLKILFIPAFIFVFVGHIEGAEDLILQYITPLQAIILWFVCALIVVANLQSKTLFKQKTESK